jgi:hypothetical protein
MFFLGNLPKRSITARNEGFAATKSKSRRANIQSATQSGPQEISADLPSRNVRIRDDPQIGLKGVGYSARAYYARSTPARGPWRISARFSSRPIGIADTSLLFFCWLPHCPGSQELRSTALMPKRQMASGVPAPEGHLLECDVQRTQS